MRVSGLLDVVFDDIGAVSRTAYATFAVNISLSIEELEEADADQYSYRKYFPGQQSWRASLAHNEVILTDLTQEDAQVALEELAFARTRFPIVFTSAAGTTYTGRAWIPSFGFASADQAVFKASLEFRGIGELVSSAGVHFLFDPESLLLYLPESIVGGEGNPLTEWTNLGTVGADGDLDTATPGQTKPGAISSDPTMGLTVGFTDNQQAIQTLAGGILPTIEDDKDSELWILFKVAPALSPGSIIGFGVDFGRAGWVQVNDYFSFGTGGSNRFLSEAIFDDSDWHVYRTIHNLVSTQNYLDFHVDGYALGKHEGLNGGLGNMDDEFVLGPFNTGNADSGFEYAMIKMADGRYPGSRARAIYGYLRDTWGISNIPADGTVIGVMTGHVGGGDINVTATLTGSTDTYGTLKRSNSFGLGRCLRKDVENEQVYFLEGGASRAKLWRIDFTGSNPIEISDMSIPNTLGRGVALNLIGQEAYCTSQDNGKKITKRSLDPDDSADLWVEILAAGTYEMWQAIEYNPSDGLIYFIDSLAATPTLRTITTTGASDTLVKSLTAGKVYSYLMLDPDANVLYFSNDTDATIDKYDIDTDTLTTSWHVPTNTPRGLDIQGGKLWYIENVTYNVYEVALDTPGSKTLKATDDIQWDEADGLAVIVFDTTA